jgi:hypothetical protein
MLHAALGEFVMVSVSLSYTGGLADNNAIEMYDAARGLAGFHRSLALTTHLILNGEIITQAPALKGARIISSSPEEGSWKVTAVIVAGIWSVVSSPQESVPGHLIFSAYDYVIKSTLGFHVDFKESLGKQYEEQLSRKKITSEKMDSLIEKAEPSISDIHRPIVASKSAKQADMVGYTGKSGPRTIGPHMTEHTFEYLSNTVRDRHTTSLLGSISSFNINTFKGRIFVFDEQRPIPFELSSDARSVENMVAITTSLRFSAASKFDRSHGVRLTVRRLSSSTGRLKGIMVEGVQSM